MNKSGTIKFADELIDKFIQLNGEFSDNAFITGDLAVDTTTEYGHLFEHADILYALADATHIQYDSLRDRERVARAVLHSARLEYPLSFHQWRACVREGVDPIPIASWAVTGGKDGGIATVEEIREYAIPDPKTPRWLKKFLQMQKLASAIIKDRNAPAHVIEMCMDIMPVQACPPMP
jgi:hypothetical protein